MTLVATMTEPVYDINTDEETKQPEPNIPCSICTKKFSSNHNLLLHQIVQHSIFPYRCTIKGCKQTFLTGDFLHAHIEATHRNKGIEKPWKCKETEKCIKGGKAFDSEIKLKAHIKRHGAKTIKCDQCDKMFISSSELDIHKRTHNNKRPYSCTTCGKTFTSHSSKKYHEDNVRCIPS